MMDEAQVTNFTNWAVLVWYDIRVWLFWAVFYSLVFRGLSFLGWPAHFLDALAFPEVYFFLACLWYSGLC
jgi:hypothetical protein